MNYAQFIIKVQEGLQERLGEEASVDMLHISKNNGIMLQGIAIRRPGEKVVPTIYLEGYYQDFLDGRDMEDILEDFLAIYEEQGEVEPPDFRFYQDYEQVKKKLALKLVNKEKNKEMLAEMPYKEFLDMAVVFYCLTENPITGTAAILVKDTHRQQWGITVDELYEDALKNAERMLPGCIKTMEEMLSKMVLEEDIPIWDWNGIEQEDFPKLEGVMEDSPMFEQMPLLILTNRRRYLGASCILYKGLLEQFAKSLRNNFFILPSSIHEVILIPENKVQNVKNLLQMLMEVNRTQLSPEEVLSDTVYYYDEKTGKISVYEVE